VDGVPIAVAHRAGRSNRCENLPPIGKDTRVFRRHAVLDPPYLGQEWSDVFIVRVDDYQPAPVDPAVTPDTHGISRLTCEDTPVVTGTIPLGLPIFWGTSDLRGGGYLTCIDHA